ncbi:CC0125/CC1285 family lipoprotein [Henriciella pelagia]|uniref:CC0125/CC1285 family lipoprotein n=1 Tax=Henriciella pelagia TaxID=1977912 RepID=UPI003519A6E5
MIKTFIPAIAGVALLGACATATPYQAASPNDRGYSNQRIEQNRFIVSFSGNSLTDRQTVETYLLYRAAELTVQSGYDHFHMVRRATDADTSFVPVGGSYAPYYSHFSPYYRFYGPRERRIGYPHYWDRWGYYDPFWGAPSEYREVTRFEASAEILMGNGPKPDDPAYFDASDVMANLGPTILRPAA